MVLYASEPALYTSNGDSLGSVVWQEVTATIPDGGLSLTGSDDFLIGLSTLGVHLLIPVGPGIPAPDATSTLVLLGLAFGGLAVLQRRLRLV
jgi:hypothetical protein